MLTSPPKRPRLAKNKISSLLNFEKNDKEKSSISKKGRRVLDYFVLVLDITLILANPSNSNLALTQT